MPPVCKTAEKMIAEFVLTEYISTLAGDMFKDELAEKFPKETDTVGFSRILHCWPAAKCSDFLKQAYNALKPQAFAHGFPGNIRSGFP